MSIQTRREHHREELRAAILEAARESFLRDGVGQFSMRKLAASIGCSPGTIYLHFESKADILHALVEEGFVRLLEALDQAHDSSDPIQSLRNKLRAYIEFGREMPHHYHFAFLMPRLFTGHEVGRKGGEPQEQQQAPGQELPTELGFAPAGEELALQKEDQLAQ